jgi:succinoglycan biosynthesis protein ExoL
MKRDLTIVIPAFNEELYIRRTITEISSQIGTLGINVIIADGGSTDRTREVIAEISEKVPLRIKVIEGGSVSQGRNLGALEVKTDYILFLDADVTFPSKVSIFRAFQHLRYKSLDAVSTTPKYLGEKDWKAQILFYLNRFTTDYLSRTSPFAIGAFTLIKRSVFENLGGYDVEIKHTEDWIFSRQISPDKFGIVHGLITQDNRRFKKYGYFRMVKLMIKNYFNRNNPDHFYKDAGYWSV